MMPKKRKSGYLLSVFNPSTGRYDKYPVTYKDKTKSLWELFKSYINSLPDGTEFTRKQMFNGVYDKTTAKVLRGHENAIDHYRLHSCHVGYLDHIGRAKYQKLHNLPQKLTSTMIKRFAFGYSPWEKWFIPKYIKMQSIKNLCK